MKFVRDIPNGRSSRRSQIDIMLGEEGLLTLRRNPSKWALIAEAQPKRMQKVLWSWGKKNNIETATRSNKSTPDTIDLYVRFQPTRRGGEDW